MTRAHDDYVESGELAIYANIKNIGKGGRGPCRFLQENARLHNETGLYRLESIGEKARRMAHSIR